MSKSNGNSKTSQPGPPAITTLSVAGFKSISEEQTIEIRPLTLLAGANSSGKSSMMQPLLLLKQTLEAQYDPGPLLLNGPNTKFTSASQFWPKRSGTDNSTRFIVTVGTSNHAKIGLAFGWDKKQRRVVISSTNYYSVRSNIVISEETTVEHLIAHLRPPFKPRHPMSKLYDMGLEGLTMQIKRSRCFLEVASESSSTLSDIELLQLPSMFSPRRQEFEQIVNGLLEFIHLPGLRGNPERTYPVSAVGQQYPGTFENYVASVIANWTSESPERVKELSDDLKFLGLTWKIEAKRVADTQVDLQVGRMPHPKHGGAKDLVSIADVGFGVSQTLPVVVALRAARPGRLVYIEQPEIHLHPRAQVAMARLLVNAATRGVRVVAETHSSLILLAVQTLVAEGVIAPELVGLNWFVRDQKTGTTKIDRAELDATGRFGDWPEDFDEVALKSESRYLAAAETRLAGS